MERGYLKLNVKVAKEVFHILINFPSIFPVEDASHIQGERIFLTNNNKSYIVFAMG